MGSVISLEEARAKRRPPEPPPSFDRAMERLFEALDLIEAKRSDDAHKAVCEGIELLLTREERMLAWPKK